MKDGRLALTDDALWFGAESSSRCPTGASPAILATWLLTETLRFPVNTEDFREIIHVENMSVEEKENSVDSIALRAELKQWESLFKEKHGRKPTRDEIKQDAIGTSDD